jgi:hypothetical protein
MIENEDENLALQILKFGGNMGKTIGTGVIFCRLLILDSKSGIQIY